MDFVAQAKKTFKKILNRSGYDFYKLPSHGSDLEDPLLYNTEQGMDRAFSGPQKIKAELSRERIAFYHEVLALCRKKGVPLDKTVCDVGCGLGEFLKILSSEFHAAKLTGSDFSDKALEYARGNCPAAVFFKQNVYDALPHSFDAVFCLEVLEHLLSPGKALGHCLKATRSGGALILTVPNGRLDNFPGHIHFWSPESWRVFIETECSGLNSETGQLRTGQNYAIVRP